MEAKRFSTTLRRIRRERKKTLHELAGVLGLSIVYLSDIERGNQRPLRNPRIKRLRAWLGADPAPLLDAAYETVSGQKARNLNNRTSTQEPEKRIAP